MTLGLKHHPESMQEYENSGTTITSIKDPYVYSMLSNYPSFG